MRNAYSAITASVCAVGVVTFSYAALKTDGAVIPRKKATFSKTSNNLTLTPPVVDLGEVGQAESHVVSFAMTNQTGNVLELLHKSKSCSCTEVVPSSEVCPPGAATEFKLTWNTGAQSGPVGQTVTLLYGVAGTGEPTHSCVFRFHARVVPEVNWTPAKIELGHGVRIARVSLGTRTKDGPRFVRATSSIPSAVRAELVDVEGGRAVEVTLLDPGAQIEGQVVLIETSDAPYLWPRIPMGSAPTSR